MNGRWIIGIKLAWLLNDAGAVVDQTWDTANVPDNIFRTLTTRQDGETVALADLGLCDKDSLPSSIKLGERGMWNDRLRIETIYHWLISAQALTTN